MNPGPAEEVAKVATGFIDSMKQQPLSLALVVMNICLLAFFYFLLHTIAAQREREIGLLYADKKEVREMLAKCVVPHQEGENSLPPFRQLTAEEPPRPPVTEEPQKLLLPLPNKGWPK